MAIDFNDLVGKVVSFQLYPSAIVTDNFTNVKIVATSTHEGVSDKISPARLHNMVYATLPEGTPNDYKAYKYLLIKRQDNTITAIGVPWIKENTVTVVGSVELVVTVRNKTIDDVDGLRRVLMENNFTDVEIKTQGINA